MSLRRLLLIVLLICTAAAAAVSAVHGQAEPEKQELFEKLNALRKRYGCGELKSDPHLDAAAQVLAEHLAAIGKLENYGPSGETIRELAMDSGYGGDKSFTIKSTAAQVWTDTDIDYLIEQIWRKDQASVKAIFDTSVRQIGIGSFDAADKHRYYTLITAGLDDGTDDYSLTRPTYDYRTPKPEASATPAPRRLITSTAEADGGIYHIVQEGETFSEIAMAYDLDWYTLASRNYLKLSDTTPVVIYEGQKLVIQPTFTSTPTPTPTKTPIPPTNTPRPTFTPKSGSDPVILPTSSSNLPAEPDWERITEFFHPWKRTVGWILVAVCVPGIFLSLRKKK